MVASCPRRPYRSKLDWAGAAALTAGHEAWYGFPTEPFPTTFVPFDDADALDRVRRYETDACRLSMQLFHDAGVFDLDQWLTDFAACDYAYLEHFYRTGERAVFLVLES